MKKIKTDILFAGSFNGEYGPVVCDKPRQHGLELGLQGSGGDATRTVMAVWMLTATAELVLRVAQLSLIEHSLEETAEEQSLSLGGT